MKKSEVMLSLVVCVSLILVGGAHAGVITVDVLPQHVTTSIATAAEVGTYYVIDLPSEVFNSGANLRSAILEIYADVSHRDVEGYEPESVLLQVVRLSSPLVSDFDVEKAVLPAPSVRAVPIGENQRILVDISTIVRHVTLNPNDNHGIVVGALKGSRYGVFDLKTGSLAPGLVGRVTLMVDGAEEE